MSFSQKHAVLEANTSAKQRTAVTYQSRGDPRGAPLGNGQSWAQPSQSFSHLPLSVIRIIFANTSALLRTAATYQSRGELVRGAPLTNKQVVSFGLSSYQTERLA